MSVRGDDGKVTSVRIEISMLRVLLAAVNGISLFYVPFPIFGLTLLVRPTVGYLRVIIFYGYGYLTLA